MIQAEIITIGNELLIGQVVDTNSTYMAQELNRIGINVWQITSVSDSREHILEALRDASKHVQLVLITGGLGPTKDDITKKVLAEFTGKKLVSHTETLRHIEQMMAARNIAMNPLNVKQAEVPEGCDVLRNSCGTAPGMWFEKDGIIYISMPGVPFEMKAMMQDEILPRLKQRFNDGSIQHRTLLVVGIPESALAIKIEEWEDQLPSFISLAYLPSGGFIRLRLTAKGPDKAILITQINDAIHQLRPLLGKHLLSDNDESLEYLVGRILAEKGFTIATAESCTGGNIARTLTSVSGSSAYFKGTIVAYSNEVKSGILHVNSKDIEQHGAVSREVVTQMSENIRQLMKTDYGIATSGIAGPTGGTPEKPVGTVWIAVTTPKQTITQMFQFGNNREHNIQRATTTALYLLIQQLI